MARKFEPSIFALPPNKKKIDQGLAVEVSVVYGVSVMSLIAFTLAYWVS